METITKKTPLDNQVLEDFMSLAGKMLVEGKSMLEIERVYKTHLATKKKAFYADNRVPMKTLGQGIKKAGLLQQIEAKANADSTVESIFYEMLKKSGIPFRFQVTIGPYRVDFLFNDTLIVELDGPIHDTRKAYDNKRDEYLKRLGYTIKRVPVWIIQVAPEAVIDEIRASL